MKTKKNKQSGKAAKKSQVTYCEEIPPGVLLYSKKQMCRLLQVSMRCLFEMMRRGEISYLKIGGRMVRFRVEDVNRRLSETVMVTRGDSEKPGAGSEEVLADCQRRNERVSGSVSE